MSYEPIFDADEIARCKAINQRHADTEQRTDNQRHAETTADHQPPKPPWFLRVLWWIGGLLLLAIVAWVVSDGGYIATRIGFLPTMIALASILIALMNRGWPPKHCWFQRTLWCVTGPLFIAMVVWFAYDHDLKGTMLLVAMLLMMGWLINLPVILAKRITR